MMWRLTVVALVCASFLGDWHIRGDDDDDVVASLDDTGLVDSMLNDPTLQTKADPDQTYHDKLTKLQLKLFTNYSRNQRPVKNENDALSISVGLIIDHLEEVDEKEQAVTIHGWLHASWNDAFLTWDSTSPDYSSIKYLWVRPYRVWRPDLGIHNLATGKKDAYNHYVTNIDAIIFASGTVGVNFPLTAKIGCTLDFSDYPYDVHRCPIAIGSWMHSIADINITSKFETVTLGWLGGSSQKILASGWKDIQLSSSIVYWTYQGVHRENPGESSKRWVWSVAEFWISFARHAPNLRVLLYLPAICTSSITLLSFFMPSKSLSLSIILLNTITQGIYMLDLIQKLPPASGKLPKIAHFYAINLCLTGLALIFFIISSVLEKLMHAANKSEEKELPLVLQRIIHSNSFRQIQLKQQQSCGRHQRNSFLSFNPVSLWRSLSANHDDKEKIIENEIDHDEDDDDVEKAQRPIVSATVVGNQQNDIRSTAATQTTTPPLQTLFNLCYCVLFSLYLAIYLLSALALLTPPIRTDY